MERFFLLQFLVFAVWLATLMWHTPVPAGAPVARPAKAFPASAEPGLNGEWLQDAGRARELAKTSGRPLLYWFTGSDWCVWCRKLHQETISRKEFRDFAAKRLVLMKVDLKKHEPQPQALVNQNLRLMEELKTEGKFPTLLFMDPAGKELGRMGYYPGGPELVLPAMEQAMAGQTVGADTPAPGAH